MDPQDLGRSLSRRDLLRNTAGAAALLTTGGILSACGSSKHSSGATTTGSATGKVPPTSPGPSSAGTPVKGGTLTIGTTSNGSAETIDIGKDINTSDYLRTQNLFDPLFFTVPGGYAPGLATSAEPNADASEWTFKLRQGVHWHDGKPLTIDDVLYTIHSWGSKASSYSGLTTSLIDFKGVRKLDDQTVRIPLLRPMAQFPAITAFYPAYVIQAGTTNFNHPIGTGPFKFQSFQPGTSSTFVANQDYWRGAPHVDKLVVNSSFTTDSARLNAVLSGQVDIAPGVPAALAKANASTGKLVLGNAPGPAFITAVMRTNEAPFDDPRVVQAMKLLTNRQAFVTDVFDGYATPGNDCPGATYKYWASDIKAEYDPEKAKSLLKAAGRSDLSLPLLTSEVVAGLNEAATLWSAQATAAGIKIPVKQMSPSVYYTSSSPGYLTGQRPLSMSYWNSLPPALAAFYIDAIAAKAQFPETAWGTKPGRDTLINQALAETNPAKAADKWHAVQEQQVKQGGYLVFANFNYLDAYSPNVRGVQTNTAGNNGNFEYYKGWLTS